MPIYVLSDDPSSGIISASPSVTVDPSDVVFGSYRTLIGDGVTTNIVINHNSGTRDINVEVIRASSPYDVVKVDVEMTTTNSVTLRFASAPTIDGYRVLIRPTE